MPISPHPRKAHGRRPSPGFAAALCVVTAVIHLEDQNWFSFDKTPGYVQVGYVFLEIAGLVTAWLLLTRPDRTAWLLAAGVGLGPFVGYVLSRGPGLPGYTDDKGAWSEPLGVVSLIVEGLLFLTALVALTAPSAPASRPAQRQTGVPTKSERDPAIR
ncbi:hypothetical protein I6A60_31820 [Frankia sp. AgB1.9]|uniref:hypothetical protein n=1 Tax=unclassified Frankia TaxID=2632575 RepID=UPI001933464A|nr:MULTISPECIES: hypothetical protein [unclassified Frankia]MBL7486797.1 hypothetical protein [Frankia sp. AgW1.1]MBL7552416.1 hypothetical protein [Frankia sp. AgB1.9]MBL7618365.1 hypothetical protein [Frankia sp. AgB1.8]